MRACLFGCTGISQNLNGGYVSPLFCLSKTEVLTLLNINLEVAPDTNKGIKK